MRYDIDPTGLVHFARGSTSGERRLEYYVGSGAAGRSFLFRRDGFLFEAPVTWYTQKNAWDVSPGYESDRASRWNRAVEPSCLFCHASQTQWREGTQNAYRDPPFEHNGVSCERCHGPGSLHVEGQGAVVNPAKLDPARRDSVCAQCHLTGEARIARAGRQIEDYRPGDRLSDFAAVFARDERTPLQVNSHVEKLAQSMCKRAAGDRLWCGTCHDPHRVPPPAERASYFRERCQTCHAPAECKRGFDCASCHMPKLPASDVRHGVFTDHSIPKVPTKLAPSPAWQLRGFYAADAGDRELGLAYAEVAARTGDRRQQAEAIRLLTLAPQDAEVEARLAYVFEKTGSPDRAATLYQAALRQDPNQIVAMVNLGRLLGSQGFLDRAIALWRAAIERNPCLEEAGANLQIALRAKDDPAAAEIVRRDQNGCIF
jgi:tetratricopeptide (TPR) repeat protein